MIKRLLSLNEVSMYKEEFRDLKQQLEKEQHSLFPSKMRMISLYKKMGRIINLLERDYQASEKAFIKEGEIYKAS
jgi:hypothetical protein